MVFVLQTARCNVFISIAIVLFIITLLLIYRYLRLKKKTNALLQQQNKEIKILEDKISRQDQKTTESMSYASVIQAAILTPLTFFDEVFPEYFIFYKPKYIVSGDFYYLNKKKDKIILAVADCTGHGVSGAFMSMLGYAYLNDIINKSEAETTDEILNELREKLITSLHQTGEDIEAKYGMDISLCIIDKEKMEIQFSGAYNPLYIISNNNLEIIRGDKIPIGFSNKQISFFTRHNITLHKDDIIYLFSDGYCDQFGGDSHKKFMVKRFGHLLLDIYQFPLLKQKEWLEKTLTEWIGNNKQVDDITVVGIKI